MKKSFRDMSWNEIVVELVTQALEVCRAPYWEESPISPNAWAYYNNTAVYGIGAGAPRHYLPIKIAKQIHRVLGRPLEVCDLQLLIRRDGEVCKCSVTGLDFQPVAWGSFTKKLAKALTEGGMTLEEAINAGELFTHGQFLADPKKKEIIAFSGTPYTFDRVECPEGKCNGDSPLGISYFERGHLFPFQRREPEEFLERAKKREKKQKINDGKVTRATVRRLTEGLVKLNIPQVVTSK